MGTLRRLDILTKFGFGSGKIINFREDYNLPGRRFSNPGVLAQNENFDFQISDSCQDTVVPHDPAGGFFQLFLSVERP